MATSHRDDDDGSGTFNDIHRLLADKIQSVFVRLPHRLAPLLFAVLLGWLSQGSVAFAFDPFTIKDIRVEGYPANRGGLVFSYLPVKVGDRMTDDKASEAIRALFATGFFKDVRVEVEGEGPRGGGRGGRRSRRWTSPGSRRLRQGRV